jgi:flagellar basal body-associated protein FliL
MKTDILIASLMVTFSVTALVAIIWTVARAIREEPRSKVKSPETAPVLRPASGW